MRSSHSLSLLLFAGVVEEAEAPGETLVMVELDRRKGPGVIPRDWVALPRAKSGDTSDDVRGVRGTVLPRDDASEPWRPSYRTVRKRPSSSFASPVRTVE